MVGLSQWEGDLNSLGRKRQRKSDNPADELDVKIDAFQSSGLTSEKILGVLWPSLEKQCLGKILLDEGRDLIPKLTVQGLKFD